MAVTHDSKFDMFISYRRKDGYDTAKHLYDLLIRDGYSVSFDIDTLRNGNFDVSLLQRIDSCTDFILIVDAHAFDRCMIPSFDRNKDWLQCELSHALLKRKNIIPIKDDDSVLEVSDWNKPTSKIGKILYNLFKE